MTLIIILILLAVLGGGWGYSRGSGYWGFSPVGLLLIILVLGIVLRWF